MADCRRQKSGAAELADESQPKVKDTFQRMLAMSDKVKIEKIIKS